MIRLAVTDKDALLPGDDLFADHTAALNEILADVRTEGASWQQQIRCVHADGTELLMEATGSMSPGDGRRALLRLRDVNEQLRIDQAIQSLARAPSD